MCVCVCVWRGRGGGALYVWGGGRCWKQNCFLGGRGGEPGSAAKGGLTEKVGIPYL